jgi:hypothetical protein
MSSDAMREHAFMTVETLAKTTVRRDETVSDTRALRVFTAVLALWATACPAAAVPSAQTPAGKADPIAEAQRLISALSSLRDLTRANVETLLKVSLGPAADFPGDPNLFEAQLPSGPFAKVRLQQPGPTQTFGPRLSLEARSGTPLPKSRFDQALIGPIVDINPHIPPEGTVTHKPAAGDTGTRLEFWKASEQLRQVTFSRARDAAK